MTRYDQGLLSDNHAQVMVEIELNQWKSRDEIIARQIQLVNNLIAYSVASCAYYKKILGSHGGHALQIRCLDDLRNIPIITKRELQENLEGVLSTSIDRNGWQKNATGGSTGQPLVFYRDARAQLWVDAAKERFRRWFGHLDEDKLALIWGADRDFPELKPANEKWLNVFKCSEQAIEAFVHELVAWQPRTVRGYAGSLQLVAEFMKARRLPPIKPHAVESAAETLTKAMRANIEAAFGAPVYDLYGSREISCIACEDQHHNGLLVADDIRLVEVIRDNTPANPGQEGKLVVTDLVNYAMPFIRYEIGDVGTVAATEAKAGQIQFSRLGKISGRTVNTISLPNGMLVHGEYFTHLFYHKPGIKAFQVYQGQDYGITVSIVPDNGFAQNTVEQIIRQMRNHTGDSIGVHYQLVDNIKETASGKRLFTISDVPLSFAKETPENHAGQDRQTKESLPAKPHIVFLADVRGWAFDINARGIAETLSDKYKFTIAYVAEQPDLASLKPDVLVVMFWGETYHRKFGFPPRMVIKQVSSHRWALESHYGCMTPAAMVDSYLQDAETVIVPSRRLLKLLSPFKDCHLAPKGYSAEQFVFKGNPAGPVRIGWAGNSKDPCKGLNDILLPAAGNEFSLCIAAGDTPYHAMCDFYNSIDVFCVASTAEGDPRTVIEALACGCFIVANDVGIVPELVIHNTNGLIINRDIAAFKAAFDWCRANIDYLRTSRAQRAYKLSTHRTWNDTAPLWSDAFASTLKKSRPGDAVTPHRIEWTNELIERFWAYQSLSNVATENYFSRQVGDALVNFIKIVAPGALNGKVLDYGCGPGYLCEYLLENDVDTWGLDFSNKATDRLNNKHSSNRHWHGAQVATYGNLPYENDTFDLVYFIEAIEHILEIYLAPILLELRRVINKRSGLLFITTPFEEQLERNEVFCPSCGTIFHRMQHLRSFKIESLIQLMEKHGFKTVACDATCFNNFKNSSFAGVDEAIRHKWFQGQLGQGPHLFWLGTPATEK